jgi:hypothetical protein
MSGNGVNQELRITSGCPFEHEGRRHPADLFGLRRARSLSHPEA